MAGRLWILAVLNTFAVLVYAEVYFKEDFSGRKFNFLKG